jgi:AcrR family transcriptional regulator
MALYRYVPGKDQLLDLMIDAALGSPPEASGEHWRSEIAAWAHASLAMFHARPWLLESILHRATIGPNWLAWLNGALRALSGSGLAASDMVPAVLLIDGHVRAAAQISLNAKGTSEWAENFAKALQQAKADPRYAALAAVIDSGGLGQSSPTATFEFGLERILDGIELHVRARPSAALHSRGRAKAPVTPARAKRG